MKKMICLVAVVIPASLLLSTAVMAAPSLRISKPPVVSGSNPYTGPVQDSDASAGQWFRDVEGMQAETVRPYEFYDNKQGSGGGLSSTNAVYGKAKNLIYQGPNIIGFTIRATITNDTPSSTGAWADGLNSHGETLHTTQKYVGTLIGTRLTTSFAIGGLGGLPSAWVPPYSDLQPYIIAQNYDWRAWYCWSPGLEQGGPTGGYFVPTYDFGNIPVGGHVTRDLSFTVSGAGLDPSDPRFGAVIDSSYALVGGGDLFAARTTSLKISNWLDTLALDNGFPYPVPPGTSSDVSVFHAVPEPGSLLALCSGLAGLGVFIRRKR